MPLRYQCFTYRDFARVIMRRRKFSQDASMDTPLNRCLGFLQLTCYTLASTMGAGLYVLTGTLIKNYAGPAASIAYLLAGTSAFFTGACYLEFTTLVPRAGSAYLYTYLMLGELPAFIIGWTMVADLIVSMASVAKAFSGSINLMSGFAISNWSANNMMRMDTKYGLEEAPDLVSFFFLLILIIFTVTGVKASLSFNVVISILQVTCLLVLVVCAFIFGQNYNFAAEGGFAPRGLIGIAQASGIAIFAFTGFEALANASEETKNPSKDIPRALFTALSICLFSYFVGSLAMSYLIPPSLIDVATPFPSGFMRIGQDELKWFAAVSTLIATGAAKIVSMYVIPRMLYAMAKDGLLFGAFGWVEKRTQVPLFSLFVGGGISMLLALFINIKTLADFTSIGVVFCYFFVGYDLIVLRYLYEDESHTLKQKPEEDEDREIITDDTTVRKVALRCWAKPLELLFPHIVDPLVFRIVFGSFMGHLFGLGIFYAIMTHTSFVWLWVAVFAILAVGTFLSFLCLCIYRPRRFENSFETKLMPLCPCVTMTANMLMLFTLTPGTWLRFVIWTVVGLIIYLSYGMWHSKVEENEPDGILLKEETPIQSCLAEEKTVLQDHFDSKND